MTAIVVGAIAPRLQQAEIDRARRKSTESLDAYDFYLRGLENVYKWTREATDEALSLFTKLSNVILITRRQRRSRRLF